MDFVVKAGGLMETAASGIPKTRRLFLISQISQEPNWESTAQKPGHSDWPLRSSGSLES